MDFPIKNGDFPTAMLNPEGIWDVNSWHMNYYRPRAKDSREADWMKHDETMVLAMRVIGGVTEKPREFHGSSLGNPELRTMVFPHPGEGL